MPRIAIVGAGPGGLLCARVLQGHGLDVTVYDADASVAARDPGGTLDLHADTGQIALQDAGLLEEFLALARLESQAKKNVDQHGQVRSSFVPAGDDAAAPEIDRGQLRSMLAEHVRPGTVRWGHRLVRAEPVGAGVHRLHFAHGRSVEVDLVIGADGAWSRVRPLVSAAVPTYTGVSFLDVCYDDADVRHPRLAELVGAGHLFANDGAGRAIIAQRNSNGRIRGYVAMRSDADWAERAGLDVDDRAAVGRYLRAAYAGWWGDLQSFLTDSESYVNRGIWVLPAPLSWPHTPGVTLVGDAAHVMSPFGGFGVNLALLDAAELAHAVAAEPTLDAAIARYERTMLPRAAEHAVPANLGLAGFFAVGRDGADLEAPDHAAEHQRFRDAATAYRHRSGAAGDVTGAWTITYTAGGGRKQVDLVLASSGTDLTGTFDGAAITDGRVDGTELRFRAKLTSPFPMTVSCTATIDTDTIAGQAKVPMMTLPFRGTRAG